VYKKFYLDSSRGIKDHEEHAFAVVFFIVYSGDHADFRQYVLGPSLMSLASSLQALIDANEKPDLLLIDGSMRRICYSLLYTSRRSWAVSSLLETDVCNILLQALRCVYVPFCCQPQVRVIYLIPTSERVIAQV
jgi:hypothetical protein